MSETRPELRQSSARAEQLIEAWNRRDVAFILDQFSDDLKLEARSPKLPDAVPSLNIRTKAQLAAALEAYRPLHSRFSIISASENAELILLTLADAEGDVLVLTLGLGEDGRIERIASYRSAKETGDGR